LQKDGYIVRRTVDIFPD
jgi:hypothetical protein